MKRRTNFLLLALVLVCLLSLAFGRRGRDSGQDVPETVTAESTVSRATRTSDIVLTGESSIHVLVLNGTTVDGLARETGLALLIAVADCGPVLLWDEVAGIIAAAHAGWRGTVAGVCERAVDAMRESGADPARVRAWIGPCIGAGHFEVGEDVAARFAPEFVRAPGKDRTRPHVDLAAAIHQRLRDAGVADTRIRHADQCTFEMEDRYWSYRRDGGICGRQFAWIARATSQGPNAA